MAAIGLVVTSCEGDDAANAGTNFQYFPLTVANSWDYDVTTASTIVTDVLVVSSSSGASFELDSTPVVANALMTGVLSNGTLTGTGGKLLGTGSLDFSFQGIDDLNVDVENAALYDQNATPNQVLFTTNGSSTQSLQGIDINITYTATTIQKAAVANMMVEGASYNDVIHSQLIINATIGSPITVAGFTTNVSIMESQDVFIVDNYWAKDIGLIKSNSQFSYQLVDLTGLPVTLPIPANSSVLTVQTLTNYNIN